MFQYQIVHIKQTQEKQQIERKQQIIGSPFFVMIAINDKKQAHTVLIGDQMSLFNSDCRDLHLPDILFTNIQKLSEIVFDVFTGIGIVVFDPQ